MSLNRENMVVHHHYCEGEEKLTYMKFAVRRKGYELTDEEKEKQRRLRQMRKEGMQEDYQKESCNQSRTRTTVKAYALSNRWETFVTLTHSAEHGDRYNLREFKKKVINQFLKENKRRRRSGQEPIKYLIIWEKHKDGAWHAHGLTTLRPEELTEFTLAERLPDYIRDKLTSGDKVYKWEEYESTIGWTVIEPIKNQAACAKYVTKYITKDMERCVTEMDERAYSCSRGLSKGKKRTGTLISPIAQPASYENDYVKTWTGPDLKRINTNNIVSWDVNI